MMVQQQKGERAVKYLEYLDINGLTKEILLYIIIDRRSGEFVRIYSSFINSVC